jgi:hypothetical protein
VISLALTAIAVSVIINYRGGVAELEALYRPEGHWFQSWHLLMFIIGLYIHLPTDQNYTSNYFDLSQSFKGLFAH